MIPDPKGLEYFQVIKDQLYTSVLSDILDATGHRHQIMRPDIRPLFPEMRIAGRAYPVLVGDVFQDPERPYDKLIDALDQVRAFEVFVANAVSGRSAFWGELLSTACLARQGHGAIIDGYARDSQRIRASGFPVFARGLMPIDSKGRNEVLDCRVPIECGGVLIHPGDLVVADYDGVVVIPRDIESDVIAQALEKARGESGVRQGLQQGRGIRELYDEYGIL